jgi:Zn-dependent metalloprotease
MPVKRSSAKRSSVSAASNGLKTFSLHTADVKSVPMINKLREERPHYRSFAASPEELPSLDPETAATRFLHQALDSKSVPSFTAPKASGTVSEFKSLGTETVPLTDTKVVKFRQNYAGIPVYGSLVTVELDNNNELVDINSSLGQPDKVNPIAKISSEEALKTIAKVRGYKTDLKGIVPKLYFYFDKAKAKWRLVFIADDVAVKKTGGKSSRAKGAAPRLAPIYMDFVVDAHSGALVTMLPRTPSLAAVVENATDGKGTKRQIQVEQNGSSKLLQDKKSNVTTFDFAFDDPQVHETRLPGKAVKNPPTPWPPAAVSAHANAVAVAAFLNAVLQRNNINNKGGPMNSSINCVVQQESDDGQTWLNAFWNGDQMVYGQTHDGKGNLVSLSVDLDVVGHEMFHGVTDSTARLEYANQSGALNESYSDIFGTIIANFDNPDVGSWNWNVGEGMAPGGKPFRSMQNPTKFGQPAHMKNFRKLPNTEDGDWGGVHTNSGIHNKAAFLVLTSKDGAGKFVFAPKEVAALFYVCLTQHLSRTSQFSDSRRGVLLTARTLFRTLPPAQLNTRISAITKAFDAVGIKA